MNIKKINIKSISFLLMLFSLSSRNFCMDGWTGFFKSACSWFIMKELHRTDLSVEKQAENRAMYLEMLKQSHNSISVVKLVMDMAITGATALNNWNVEEDYKKEQLQIQKESAYATGLKDAIDSLPEGSKKDHYIRMLDLHWQQRQQEVDASKNGNKIFSNEKLQAYLEAFNTMTNKETSDIQYYKDVFGDNENAYRAYFDNINQKINNLVNSQQEVKNNLALSLNNITQLPDKDIKNTLSILTKMQGSMRVLVEEAIDTLQYSNVPFETKKIENIQNQFARDGYVIVRQFDLENQDRTITKIQNASSQTGIVNKAKYAMWDGPNATKNIGYIASAGGAILITIKVGGSVLAGLAWIYAKARGTA